MSNNKSFSNATKLVVMLALISFAAAVPVLLAPETIRQYMFTQEIDGTLPTLIPDNQVLNSLGKVTR